MAQRVLDYLDELKALHEDRAAVYGENYRLIGKTMMGLFPKGLEIRTEDDFNRLHLFFHMVGKLSRYAAQMPSKGHAGSLDDLAVYALITKYLDEEKTDDGT